MAALSPMPHYQTFARLREATLDDLPVLAELSGFAETERQPGPDWRRIVVSRAARVTLACECGLVVGAAVALHRPGSAIARLHWLGVARSARRRGVGRLLLEAVMQNAKAAGAAVLRADTTGVNQAARHLLVAAGFPFEIASDLVQHERSLWAPGHAAERGLELPGVAYPAASALMLAMARLDNGFMVTRRVESTLHHEVQAAMRETGCREAAALATAATRRGVDVRRYLTRDAQEARGADGAGMLPTAVELAGELSRGNVPLLRCAFPRLHRQAPARWLVVAGFDGFLFRVFDPERHQDRIDAVTLAEMRSSLRGMAARPDEGEALVLCRRDLLLEARRSGSVASPRAATGN